MNVLFVKQGIARNGYIESAIQRAAAQIPDLRFSVVDLAKFYFSQTGALREQEYATRVNRAIGQMLPHILRDTSDYVLVLNGFVLHWYYRDFFQALKKAGKTIVTWQIDDPYYVDKALRFIADVDFAFTVDSSTLSLYRSSGRKAEFLPLACDPELHRSYSDSADRHHCDVCFVGTPFAGSRRTRLIDDLAAHLRNYEAKIIGATNQDTWIRNLKRFDDIKHCIRDEEITPGEAARYFSGARINLNIHKDSYGHAWDRNERRIDALSPCERTFAIAGCGGFQLIDDTRPDLAGQFVAGEDLVLFTDVGDLVEKIGYYLKHEEERREIAQAGQARAYARHTYRHRLSTLLGFL